MHPTIFYHPTAKVSGFIVEFLYGGSIGFAMLLKVNTHELSRLSAL
jgi:hypothetical protein